MNKNELSAYLDKRGVNDPTYRNFITKEQKNHKKFKLCSVNKFDFIVDHFLDSSEIIGYGLEKTNIILGTNSGSRLAIALIEGDDVVCMDVITGSIALWMVQTGNGEYIKISDSFQSFICMCCEE
ncbi:MAG: hypothetical protein ACI3XO_05935 [Eubacteriales bacterium]